MTATNHTVTGAVIAVAASNPYVVLPAALLSHLVLDAMPHYGNPDHTSRPFLLTLAADAGLAAAFLLSVFWLRIDNWPLIISAGILAASPDLLWLPGWLKELSGRSSRPTWLHKFLARIQWAESRRGYFVEIAWLVIMVFLFFRLAF